jgi:hypothetical protein
MPKPPEDNRPETWHRFFAAEANNRAWDLAEQWVAGNGGTEVLDAAHASAWHWRAAGTELHHMRATMLLAHVHALVGHGQSSLAYAREMHAWFLGKPDTPDWEVAFARTILANAARVAGSSELYESEYQAARASVAAIADEEDKAIVLRTFRQVPVP